MAVPLHVATWMNPQDSGGWKSEGTEGSLRDGGKEGSRETFPLKGFLHFVNESKCRGIHWILSAAGKISFSECNHLYRSPPFGGIHWYNKAGDKFAYKQKPSDNTELWEVFSWLKLNHPVKHICSYAQRNPALPTPFHFQGAGQQDFHHFQNRLQALSPSDNQHTS